MAFKKLTEKQFKDISYYRYGLGPRPKTVPHITKTNYGYVLQRWVKFDAWNKWQDKGRPEPRPDNVWKAVPQWEKNFNPWDLRKAILKARPHTPAPPPSVPTPPVPPLPANAAQYQRVAYMAEDPMNALKWKGCKIAFSADPIFDHHATRADADKARSLGHDVYVWYVPTQVSKARAELVATRLRATVIIGQAETISEFWKSWEDGIRAVIGNIGPCVADPNAHKLIATGQMIFVNEFYWNTRRGMDPDNMTMPVVSMCVAVYNAGPDGENKPDGWDPTMQDYFNHGYLFGGMSVYGTGMTDADWQLLNNQGI